MPSFLTIAVLVIALAVGVWLLLYLAWIIHRTLNLICAGHARKFCAKRAWTVQRARWQPAFDESGLKTESTLVQLDCVDAQEYRKLILLLVWPFGVRKIVSEEPYLESYGEHWPDTPG